MRSIACFMMMFICSTTLMATNSGYHGSLLDCRSGKVFGEIKKLELASVMGLYTIETNETNQFKIIYTGSRDDLAQETKIVYDPQTQVLTISGPRTTHSWKNVDVSNLKATVSIPAELLTNLGLSVGRIKVVGPLKADATFDLTGSGVIEADEVSNQTTVLLLSGSGTMNIAELKTDTLGAKLSGSSVLKVGSGQTNNMNISLSGARNAELQNMNVTNLFDVSLSGAGNIKVAGQLKDVNCRLSGVGNISLSKVSGNVLERKSGMGHIRIEKG